jgi:hypothetical protein
MWLPAPAPILRADMPTAAEAFILSENTARLYELVAKSEYRGLVQSAACKRGMPELPTPGGSVDHK